MIGSICSPAAVVIVQMMLGVKVAESHQLLSPSRPSHRDVISLKEH